METNSPSGLRSRMSPAGVSCGTTVTSQPRSTRWRRMFSLAPQSMATTFFFGLAAATPPCTGQPAAEVLLPVQGVLRLTSATRLRPIRPGAARAAATRSASLSAGSVLMTPFMRSVDAERPRDRPGVHAGEADDAPLGEEGVEAARRAEAALGGRVLADHEAADLHAVALQVLDADPVVADHRCRHHDDLPGVGGVGQDLLVARHARVEAHLGRNGGGLRVAEGVAGEHLPVGEGEAGGGGGRGGRHGRGHSADRKAGRGPRGETAENGDGPRIRRQSAPRSFL